jgi:hypothetical protein
MLHLATVFALVSAVATAPPAVPSSPTTLPAASPAALVATLPDEGVPTASSPTTAIRTTGPAAPKHSIIEFPWTRHFNMQQQNAAMEAELGAFSVTRSPSK